MAAVLLVTVGGTAARARAKPCAPPHSRPLVENHVARVFQYTRRNEEKVGCVLASNLQTQLDFPIDDVQAYGPPSLDLAGPVVGYAFDECEDSGCRTTIGVRDLTRRRQGTIDDFLRASVQRRRLVKVGSLRVRRTGGVAWTTCPNHRGGTFGVNATQRPNCIAAGDKVRVVKLDAGKRPVRANIRVLDRGRTIDPSSLRLSHGRLSWTHGSVRRHARLR